MIRPNNIREQFIFDYDEYKTRFARENELFKQAMSFYGLKRYETEHDRALGRQCALWSRIEEERTWSGPHQHHDPGDEDRS